ncbi:MAG: DUF1223 domain-containing protein [Terriglobales bacterium]|jgi:hypothetical protein
MTKTRAACALRILIMPALCLCAAASDLPRSDAPSPVLVELFTSEGCSSCPPADRLLQNLDASQPVPGAQVIVLSEHVDYWNHDGWKDVYSSGFFTTRQEDYERRFGLSTAYTPQMVIDGAAQLNGSDARAVGSAIDVARRHAKIPVRISSVSVADERTLRVHLDVEALPPDFESHKADIFVAIALGHAASHVSAGENKGLDLRHVAVAESISKVGTLEKGRGFDREVLVKVKSTADPGNLRVIAFVQRADAGGVAGASELSASVPR